MCFATVGNAGCAEGIFWEVLNAAGVLQVPLLISVWDGQPGDGRGGTADAVRHWDDSGYERENISLS